MPVHVVTRVISYVQRLLDRYFLIGPTDRFRCELERRGELLLCAQQKDRISVITHRQCFHKAAQHGARGWHRCCDLSE